MPRPTVNLRLEELEDRLVPTVSYHGGPVMPNIRVETVYYGDAWQNKPALVSESQDLDNFFATITDSPYMDMLVEYGVYRGSFQQHDNVNLAQRSYWDGTPVPMTITDQSIINMLDANITDPNSPVNYPTGNTLYVVFTAPGVSVDYATDNGFAGYHAAFTDSQGEPVYYAVIPYDSFDGMTVTASHELSEAATDPDVATGWFDSSKGGEGEIGDLANNDTGTLYGYSVQAEWSNRLQTGTLPADAVWNSWDDMTQAPNDLGVVAGAIMHSEEHYERFVVGAYQRYLGRTPAASEAAGWVGLMENGLSDEQLEANFIGSVEYIRNHGGPGAGWVTGMYRDLLGRNPAQSEVNGWVYQLNHGTSTTTVAYGFAASYERESQRVQADYQTLLGRSASLDEVNGWVTQFQRGMSNEDVVAGFGGSFEYFYDHGSNVNEWLDAAYSDMLNRPLDGPALDYWQAYLL
jgi:hypothetical protein